MSRFWQATVASFLMATPVLSGGLPQDFVTASGWVSLGASDRVTGADAFLVADTQVRLSFYGVTAEVGVFGRADALDTPHETYGAIGVYLTPDIHLSAGVPRPAYDGFAVSALERRFPSLAIDRAQTTRSAATQGAMFANWLPYGVSLVGTTGDLRFAISAHYAEVPDETVVGAGLAGSLGGWALSGAIEAVGDDGRLDEAPTGRLRLEEDDVGTQ